MDFYRFTFSRWTNVDCVRLKFYADFSLNPRLLLDTLSRPMKDLIVGLPALRGQEKKNLNPLKLVSVVSSFSHR